MPDSRAAGAAIAVLAVVTLSACSSAEAGQPTPTTSASGSSGGQTSISLPPRPKTISMNGVDPCTLLTSAQQAQFKVEPGQHVEQGHHAAGLACAFADQDPVSTREYDINADTTPGADSYLNPRLAVTDTVKQTSIAGFPALNVTLNISNATGCTTVVDVADGQMLTVDNGTVVQGQTKAQSCEQTNAVAEAAMSTLQTRK